MGSSQSQPFRRSRRSPPTDTASPNPHRPSLPHTYTNSSSSSALSSLRRLSTFGGRRENSHSKRGRAGSAGSLNGDQKKRRVVEDNDRASNEAGPSMSITPSSISPPSMSVEPNIEAGLSDPLIAERLQSLSAIRDTLGPDWPALTSNTPTATERLESLRRQSASVDTAPPRLGDRLCSLLRIPSGSQSAENTPPPPAVADNSVDELTTQLEQASADLAETQRQIDEVRDRLDTPETNTAAGGSDSGTTETTGLQTRIPAGAVLVIQGLAQTNAPEERPARDSTGANGGRRAGRARSASESQVNDDGQGSSEPGGQGDEEDHNGASLDTQARMIGSLLTVAAAATATTLLAPAPTPTTPASSRPPSASSALSSFLDRFRPTRRSSQSIETALGEYLRNALRDRNRLSNGERLSGPPTGTTSPEPAPADPATAVSSDFQIFLETLQGDLVRAVHAFVEPIREDEPPQDSPPVLPVDAMEGESESKPNNESTEESPSESIPTFHYQPGQVQLDDETRRFGVSGGTDGQPRRLNFFRAHLFPPVREDQNGAQTTTDDPNGTVPSIFVGVRSISHDPAMTTDELVSHPSFPFIDGHVPSAQTPSDDISSVGSDGPIAQERPGTPAVTSERPERRSFRERVLERLGARRPPRPNGPLNTYLVFVIGGYYPRSHPVLSIPNLATGGPLTDEEMALVSELMGPGKPPTATKEDIESSGLMVVDATKIPQLGQEGIILESCVDRCLICLGDYEEGEECRVLKCRHAYHRECVDKWLSKGRNSCPACRTEAVEISKKASTLAPDANLASAAGPSIVPSATTSVAMETE